MTRPLLLLLVSIAILCGCDRPSPPPAEAKLVTHRFHVEGMHCDSCVAAISHAVRGVEGVHSCEVSLDGKFASVTATENVSETTLMRKVADLGFTVSEESAPSTMPDYAASTQPQGG